MIKHLRWYIVGLLTFATAINYLDRNALSIAQTVLDDEFGMTSADYGKIVAIFLAAYGIMHPFTGKIMDYLGTRRGLASAFVWWSIAGMGHALAGGVASFGIMRALLGIGESANFPAAIKTVSEWFPAKERALATGIFNVGAGLGAVAAPLIVGTLIIQFGWRAAFVATGAIGLIWLIPWLLLSHSPESNKRLTPEERQYIQDGQVHVEDKVSSTGKIGWRQAIGDRNLWGLSIARFMSDPAWLFFSFWIPKYFKDARDFDLKQIAMFTWMPFLAADIGSVAGGALSSYLIKRGISVVKARKIAMCVCASLMPSAILAVRVDSWQYAMVCLSIAAFAHQAWAASVLTLPADVFPKTKVGFSYGFTAAWGILGGALFQLITGGVIDRLGYIPVFTVAGLLHPVAAIMVVMIVRQPAKVPQPLLNERALSQTE